MRTSRPTGKPAAAGNFAAWCFEGGKAAEISTLPERHVLQKQIGYLRDEASAGALCSLTVRRESPAVAAAGGPRLRRRATGAVLTLDILSLCRLGG